MYVYQIGSNPESNTNSEVMIKLKLLEISQTDLPSNIAEATRSPQKELSIEILNKYQVYHADIAQIVCIASLDNQKTFQECYLDRESDLKPVKYQVNRYVKYRNFDKNKPIENANCIPFYLAVEGVLNKSTYVPEKYNGVIYKYYDNGKLNKKQFYQNGSLMKIYGYYDNRLNNLKYELFYNEEKIERELVYDPQIEERLIGQFIYRNDRICKKYCYGNNKVKSVYQSDSI